LILIDYWSKVENRRPAANTSQSKPLNTDDREFSAYPEYSLRPGAWGINRHPAILMTNDQNHHAETTQVDRLIHSLRAKAQRLQPGLTSIQHTTLDSHLDRDFGFDSLGRVDRAPGEGFPGQFGGTGIQRGRNTARPAARNTDRK
jgi:hypothetical protein